MGPLSWGADLRADLDFLAVQFRRCVQDQGADAGAEVEHDAAGARRAQC
jgi:hypothetical protein